MRFVVGPFAAPVCVLAKDNWNDYFKWYTLYSVTVVMSGGRRLDLGGVKIGRKA